jgi:ABC-type branched-subunit amino acid transport system substrate-binding protein
MVRGMARRRAWYPGMLGFAVGAILVSLLVPFTKEEATVSAGAGRGVSAGAVPGAGGAAGVTGSGAGGEAGGDAMAVGADADAGSAGGAGGGTSGSDGGSAGTSSGGGEGAGASGGGAQQPAGPLRATDTGVTGDTIKLGFLLLDLGSTGRIGVNTTGVDPDQQKAAFEAFMADINNRGGINGRKLVGFYRVFDVTNPDDQRAACLAATEDAKVFAVIAMPGFANAAVLCVTHEHKTPLILTGQGISRSFLNQSQGRLTTLSMAGDRMMRNFAAELDAKGALRGRTIGVVSSDEANFVETIEGVLVPALKDAGHKVAHVSRLATWPRSQGQIAPEVQRMRAAGVDTIIFAGSFLNATPWVQTAEQQQWRPRYLVSEFGGMTSDFEVQAMPQSFHGALAMTSQRFGEWRENVPEEPREASCRELYEKATGEQVPRNKGEESNGAYPVVQFGCGMLKVFEAAAAAAGPELTRDSYGQALQQLGPTESAFYFPGAFGPGKTDLSDMVRFNQFDFGCRCWKNQDAPRKVRF